MQHLAGVTELILQLSRLYRGVRTLVLGYAEPVDSALA